ncbi:YfiR family protein [bacterium]|nr:YfiR family protein [bacterium]
MGRAGPFFGRAKHRARRLFSLNAAFAILCLLLSSTPAYVFASQTPLESEIKAAFLLNFAKLVIWPDSESDSMEEDFLIGIHGDSQLLKVCREGLQGKAVGALKIKVLKVGEGETFDLPVGMKILFISKEHKIDIERTIASVTDRPVLLVSDHAGFAHMGGSIELVQDKNHMGFEINRAQEFRSGMKINSRLLRIAQQVVD